MAIFQDRFTEDEDDDDAIDEKDAGFLQFLCFRAVNMQIFAQYAEF